MLHMQLLLHIITYMDQQKLFKEHLRTAGERVSSPRLAIFQVLERHSPITIPKLVAQLRKQAIDPSTIYRNIVLFRKLGMINDLTSRGLRLVELSDSFGEHHHHFVCRNCGKVIDFDNHDLEEALAAIASEMGVEATSHHIEMSGLCDVCKRR
jgi:Fe2+ or Zn2+ uptake regulation protein